MVAGAYIVSIHGIRYIWHLAVLTQHIRDCYGQDAQRRAANGSDFYTRCTPNRLRVNREIT